MPTDTQTATKYVYIEDDGTARELEADEIEYLSTTFHGADGARPYIKSSYEQRTPDNRPVGYLLRSKLPDGVEVKSISEAVPVRTPEDAIVIAKDGLPVMYVVKSGTPLVRVVGKSGRAEFGVPGLDVSLGGFSATLDAGVWRVVRTPDPTRAGTEHSCFVDISAASGRIIRYGAVAAPEGSPPHTVKPVSGTDRRAARQPWWKFWA